MRTLNDILNFIIYGYGKWKIVIVAMVVLVILLCVLIAKISAANKARRNMMEKIDSSINTIGNNVSEIKENIEDKKSKIETYIRNESKTIGKSGDPLTAAHAKLKHKHVVGIDNRIEPLQVYEEDEFDDIVTIESILDGTATAIYKKGLAKDSAKIEKEKIGSWLKDVKPEHKSVKDNLDTVQKNDVSYVSRYDNRNCGTDKNGNTYTEEQLRRQIK